MVVVSNCQHYPHVLWDSKTISFLVSQSRATKYKSDFNRMVVNLQNYTTLGYHTNKYVVHTSVLFQIHVNEQLPNKLMTYSSIIYITARQKLHLDIPKL